MPFVYRRKTFITVSESSKKEMQDAGIFGRGIEVVHPGIDLNIYEPGSKHLDPLVLYVGRLKAYKSVDVLLRAFEQVSKKVKNAKLIIAGGGEEYTKLKTLAEKLNLLEKVHFTGKISEEEKISWYQKAWVFVNPSFMEGWGITSIEANACGVPVVASRVPGLIDSVNNPHTGYLVTHGEHELFAEKIVYLLTNHDQRKWMSGEALKWAENFNWDESARQALEIIASSSQKTMSSLHPPVSSPRRST